MSKSYNPERINPPGLGYSHFVRHYSGNRIRFLFLRLLRCFTSAGLLYLAYFIQQGVVQCYLYWVSPFGHSRIKARLPLPETYRSLATSFIASHRLGIHLLLLIT
jgi:hypothetical protein